MIKVSPTRRWWCVTVNAAPDTLCDKTIDGAHVHYNSERNVLSVSDVCVPPPAMAQKLAALFPDLAMRDLHVTKECNSFDLGSIPNIHKKAAFNCRNSGGVGNIEFQAGEARFVVYGGGHGDIWTDGPLESNPQQMLERIREFLRSANLAPEPPLTTHTPM